MAFAVSGWSSYNSVYSSKFRFFGPIFSRFIFVGRKSVRLCLLVPLSIYITLSAVTSYRVVHILRKPNFSHFKSPPAAYAIFGIGEASYREPHVCMTRQHEWLSCYKSLLSCCLTPIYLSLDAASLFISPNYLLTYN